MQHSDPNDFQSGAKSVLDGLQREQLEAISALAQVGGWEEMHFGSSPNFTSDCPVEAVISGRGNSGSLCFEVTKDFP